MSLSHPLSDIAMTTLRTLLLLSTFGLAAGCSDHGDGGSVFQYFSVNDGNIAVHAPHAPDAIIAADGALSIGGKPVALSAAQQELLKHHYADVVAVREHAYATGAAGAATGRQALASVASGLANGTPDKIGAEIEARAAKVEAEAAKICADLADIRITQQAIAQQVTEFKPYALIDTKTVADCSKSP
jgi:hypothetical protein